MTRQPEQPPRQSIIREIVELLKEHPQLGKWAKILGGGYLIVQVLGLIFGAAILYTIYSSFQSNTSKFDEQKTAFDKAFNEEWNRRDKVFRELDKNAEEAMANMKKWDETSKRSRESMKKVRDDLLKPMPQKEIFSPDETDLNTKDHFEQEKQ
jgi:hypothetical protein